MCWGQSDSSVTVGVMVGTVDFNLEESSDIGFKGREFDVRMSCVLFLRVKCGAYTRTNQF